MFKEFIIKKNYQILIMAFSLFAYLPLVILYALFVPLFLILAFLWRYRYSVISSNLKRAFPNRKPLQLKWLMLQFYWHFCCLIAEFIKQKRLSAAALSKRVTISGEEELNAYFHQNKSVVVLAMHYGNWEWQAITQQYIKHKILMVYRPLKHKLLNNFVSKIRERYGAKAVPMQSIYRTMCKLNNEGTPTAAWLCADQKSSNNPHWAYFLGQESSFRSGVFRMAIKHNQPIFFHRVQRCSIGRYHCSIELMFAETQHLTEAEILKAYIAKMESVIYEQPAYYLWSHDRFRYKRSKNEVLIA